MRIFLSKQLTIFLVTTIALAQIACEETHDAEAENQESIYTLIQDLRVATSSNDEDSLDALIASANRLQPSSSSQTQSKNLQDGNFGSCIRVAEPACVIQPTF